MADAGPLIMAIGRIANDEEVSLEMRDIKIGAGGAAALASALKGNRRLTAADLYNTGIGEGGVEALASAMADGNGRVSVLDVGCNDLSLAGAAALARLIRARPLGTWEEPDEYGGPARQVLRELRLARNEVDAQACAALVSAEHAEGGSGKADGGGGGRGRGRGGGGGAPGVAPLALARPPLRLPHDHAELVVLKACAAAPRVKARGGVEQGARGWPGEGSPLGRSFRPCR